MSILFDRSAETGILITCEQCEYWFSYRFDQAEAYDSGAAHALRAHGDNEESKRLQNIKSLWLKREAEKRSRNVGKRAQDAPHGTSGHSATGALERTDADSVTHRIDSGPRPRGRR